MAVPHIDCAALRTLADLSAGACIATRLAASLLPTLVTTLHPSSYLQVTGGLVYIKHTAPDALARICTWTHAPAPFWLIANPVCTHILGRGGKPSIHNATCPHPLIPQVAAPRRPISLSADPEDSYLPPLLSGEKAQYTDFFNRYASQIALSPDWMATDGSLVGERMAERAKLLHKIRLITKLQVLPQQCTCGKWWTGSGDAYNAKPSETTHLSADPQSHQALSLTATPPPRFAPYSGFPEA